METRTQIPDSALVFRDITFTVRGTKSREQKTILKEVSGCFLPGRLTAIIGPSGSGKTTLMNILSGFRTRGVSGKVMVGGKVRSANDFRHYSCYIEQEVAMMGQLTAQETLKVASRLKMPLNISKEQREKMVTQIVNLLGLDGCQGTMVQNLSGGEKKRLSIAVELTTNPPIMFFDEPTSNLDSMASQTVLNHLRGLADSGRVVVCVVHQPSSKLFSMFDDMMILSGGEAIYHGPVSDLVPFLRSYGLNCPDFYNPSDFAIEVSCGEHMSDIHQLVADTAQHLKDQYESGEIKYKIGSPKCITVTEEEKEESGEGEATKSLLPPSPSGSTDITVLNIPNGLKPEKGDEITNGLHNTLNRDVMSHSVHRHSIFAQMSVLLWRSSICTYRSLYLTQLTLFGHLLVGLLLGAIFYNIGGEASKAPSNAGCLFFFLLFLFFANAMPTVQMYPIEMPVIIRQYRNGWFSLRAYFLAKNIADIPMQVISPTLFLVAAYFLTGQPPEWYRGAMVWAVCVSYTALAQGVGLIFGAAFQVDFAVFLVPLTTIPMLLFSGFFVLLGDLPSYVSCISYLSHARYAYEGAMQAIYGFNRTALECSEAYCHFRKPEKLLNDMQLDKISYWTDLTALLVFLLVTKIALYIVLRWKVVLRQ